jgi:hypothetical protein
MEILGCVARVTITSLLMISLSGIGFYPCLPSAPSAVASKLGGTSAGCCCCQGTGPCTCGMACSPQQTPPRNERQAPQRSDREQTQLVIMLVPLAGLLGADLDHGSSLATFFSELESRLAPPTLQSQHICMQV